MKKTIFLLLLVNLNSLFPQEYVNLFLNDLPGRVRNESFIRESAESDLAVAASIHPEMFYYYIMYYSGKYNGIVNSGFSVSSTNLTEARRSYIKKNVEWFLTQENNLQLIENDLILLKKEKNILSEYNLLKEHNIKSSCDSCYKTNLNRRDYFVYKYYLNDSKLTYNETENYSQLRKNYENKILQEEKNIPELLNTKTLDLDEAENKVKQITDHWYLYSEENEKNMFPAELIKLIVSTYNSLGYYKNDHFKLAVNYYSFIQKQFRYSFDIPNDIQFHGTAFDIPVNQVVLEAGYTFHLSRRFFPFSQISVQAGFGWSKTNKYVAFSDHYEMSPYNGERHTYFVADLNPQYNNLEIKSVSSFNVKLKAPIIHLGEKLIIGAGCLYSLRAIAYNSQLKFAYEFVEPGIGEDGTPWIISYIRAYKSHSLKEDVAIFKTILPLLTAEYALPIPFSLSFELWPDNYIFGVSYNVL